MVVLSRRNLECLSRQILSDYLTQQENRLECIDPVDFADKMCGIRFEFIRMELASNVLGLTAFGDVDITIPCENAPPRTIHLDGKTAFISQELVESGQVGRVNFTLMHEAAHHLLDRLFPCEYSHQQPSIICRLADESCRRPITDWGEWRVNVLTSCLLLPRELVHIQMERHGLGERIRLLNRVFAPREYECFVNMADALGVSKTALAIRLDQLGLIDRNDFHNPYALVDIFAD